jgi:hypothetical protein
MSSTGRIKKKMNENKKKLFSLNMKNIEKKIV